MQIWSKSRCKSIVAALFFILSCIPATAQWDKDVFMYRGRVALQEGKFSAAIDNFNILSRLDTSDYWVFFFRGIAKYNLGDLRGARSDFDRSVRLNPVFTNGYHYRAITESRGGDYDAAFKDFDKAISLRPGSEGLYYSRGITYFLSQQFGKAIADFNRFIRKQPKEASAYLNRGASYLYSGDTTAALEDYNKAIKINRFDAEGYIRRGRLMAELKQYDLALADLDKAVELDKENSFAIFNRALVRYELSDLKGALADMDRVLELEPGNAVTLYNRGLVKAQLRDWKGPLADMDRVLNINPENVLVYFNRASIFIEMGRYMDALEDYDRAIALYPDFAKAYMNRSYVKNLLGRNKSSRDDYNTAQRKIREYRAKNIQDAGSFADTTKKYSSLIALDGDFAKKDFNDEMLQWRDIDVKLRPFYKFVLADGQAAEDRNILSRVYENSVLDRFIAASREKIKVSNKESDSKTAIGATLPPQTQDARDAFLRALHAYQGKQFNSALANYDLAVENADGKGLEAMYLAFYLMNRGVLRAEMIDFIASIESNAQVLSMDDGGTTRARVRDKVSRDYDYSQAIEDLRKAEAIAPGIAYILYDLGNLYCLSGEHITAIKKFTQAIAAYPNMADAYFNRALVQIYLKDREKGCNDLSVAGSLGLKEAYPLIKKYCEGNEIH